MSPLPESPFPATVVMNPAGKSTENGTVLLAAPATVTTTSPVLRLTPDGTVVTIVVLLQLLAVAAVPLNVTELLPFVTPKNEPLMVTDVPTGPDVDERLLIV